MTEIAVKVGDLLDEVADVVVSTANPWLKMSGGVNGAILLRGGEVIQEELRAYLRDCGRSAVQPGSVVVTGPGPLRAKHLLHAVAIDPFYDSSIEIVRQTVECVLKTARRLGAKTVAMPALATGYGHLSMEQFAEGFSLAADAVGVDWSPIEHLIVVVRKPENADTIRRLVQAKRDAARE
jgi:O-acetyl-ADP-ribose deacetylase